VRFEPSDPWGEEKGISRKKVFDGGMSRDVQLTPLPVKERTRGQYKGGIIPKISDVGIGQKERIIQGDQGYEQADGKEFSQGKLIMPG